ncbi:leptin receptor gene-related protein-like isoform X2 [Varroa destructor]|uniref:Leptin receptor overlapping transcript-like 1 n=1 Tax=Varroa destructor TaxID=109461 RepID=A0A7M7JWK1_VARDE|nr:leptin receptor gene-related protein-like isoform X2 [Varroa destructor]
MIGHPKYIALVALAFTGSVGMTMLILACALPEFGTWYPLINVIWYLATVPLLLIARNGRELMSSSNPREEVALFLTALVVISAFALPVTLARSRSAEGAVLVQWPACGLTLFANVIVYGTIFGFFISFGSSDNDYSTW